MFRVLFVLFVLFFVRFIGVRLGLYEGRFLVRGCSLSRSRFLGLLVDEVLGV